MLMTDDKLVEYTQKSLKLNFQLFFLTLRVPRKITELVNYLNN